MSGFRLTSSNHNVNLWIVPLKMSLAAVALFAITITPDMLAAYHLIHIPDWFTIGGIDDARAILSAMLRCVSTVLALIFSVALHSATQRRCWTALPGVLPRRTPHASFESFAERAFRLVSERQGDRGDWMTGIFELISGQ